MRYYQFVWGLIFLWCGASGAESAVVTVDTQHPGHTVSRYLTGACIEDVNHEIYGGLYSQMIFGERFQEPGPFFAPQGFLAVEGAWAVEQGVLGGPSGDGPKLIAEGVGFADGEAGVEVFFENRDAGCCGLIVRVSHALPGMDAFDGYEVSLDCAAQVVRIGRHRQNWELLCDTPCAVPVGEWIPLKVVMQGSVLAVDVNGRRVVSREDTGSVLGAGTVGLRQWKRGAQYRNFWMNAEGNTRSLPFVSPPVPANEISGMWRPVRSGTATGAYGFETERPYCGGQSQRVEFQTGEGRWGVENRGLNRWGLNVKASAAYEGLVWVRAAAPTELWVSLENADGSIVYAENKLEVSAGDWQRLPFELIPHGTDPQGRFSIALKKPGVVDLGYAYLQPGDWGRFKGLPVRRDVAEQLIAQGITILRYGGSMVNHAEYRWKNMIGPRDGRPPYQGTWYPYSSNGWGIVDFMDFCEAAGFEYVPSFNANETPEDMADFIHYAKDPADSDWGKKRAEDGHADPYRLRYVQIGNEERVDEGYATRFGAIAEAVWPLDPELVLVVGDFVYGKPINDPFHFSGQMAGLTTLQGQQQILELARKHDREVWFDVHVGTDGPHPDDTFSSMFTYIDAMEKIAAGARFRVAVFEFNSNNHRQQRALANALAINAIERDGRLPVAISANGLQPDGQNDNGWDQGLLFLNPTQVWLQPPGWVTQMVSRHYQPVSAPVTVTGDPAIDVSAKRSEDGRTLVLQIVHLGAQEKTIRLALPGFSRTTGEAVVETLSAPLDAANTAAQPLRVAPQKTAWHYRLEGGETPVVLAPLSYTVIAMNE